MAIAWLLGADLFLLRVPIAGLSGAADMTFDLLDLQVVFDDVDLATSSSIASLGYESRASVVSFSLGQGSRGSVPSVA